MRIISGKYKGRKLIAPRGGDIRPTSDMAREALFSVLARWPVGGFLDVFSGTGAIALEALSRGYSPVWCIEQSREAIACIKENCRGTDLNIARMDLCHAKPLDFKALSYQVAPKQEKLGMTATRKRCPQVFDNTDFARVIKNLGVSRSIPIERNLVSVVFADPPYDKTIEMWAKLSAWLCDCLAVGGVLVWECHKAIDLPESPGLACACEKRYGSAKFLFFERVSAIGGHQAAPLIVP